MDLTLQKNSSKNIIQNYEDNKIYVDGKKYPYNLIITEDGVERWEINNLEQLSFDSLKHIIDKKPDIIILGTGDQATLPNQDIINKVSDNGVGIEFMTTKSACKTFNVLLAEDRKVIALLIV